MRSILFRSAPLQREAVIDAYAILIRKLKEHSRLQKEDVAEIRGLTLTVRDFAANEDFVRQGDRPKASALVVSGLVARYHLLRNGRRQYLSFHLAGDMPDSQALFVDQMDHSVCALGPASVASIPHSDLMAAFQRRPSLAFAIWRETLIDAAIFREAITNNSARAALPRMAHLLCEIYYRSRASGLTADGTCAAPITLQQLGEALGMALASVNRVLPELRQTGAGDLRNGRIVVRNWDKLAKLAQFDPGYLHLKRQPL